MWNHFGGKATAKGLKVVLLMKTYRILEIKSVVKCLPHVLHFISQRISTMTARTVNPSARTTRRPRPTHREGPSGRPAGCSARAYWSRRRGGWREQPIGNGRSTGVGTDFVCVVRFHWSMWSKWKSKPPIRTSEEARGKATFVAFSYWSKLFFSLKYYTFVTQMLSSKIWNDKSLRK